MTCEHIEENKKFLFENGIDIEEMKKANQHGFKFEDIEFASVSNGKIGSIYFPNGRIRLIHRRGPGIYKHENVKRFTISNDHLEEMRKNSIKSISYLEKCPSFKKAEAGSGEKLLEFFENKQTPHISRGGPKVFKIQGFNQESLNLLCNAADLNRNEILQMVLKSDPVLCKIPVAVL